MNENKIKLGQAISVVWKYAEDLIRDSYRKYN
jgi:hypothetical protein